MPLDVVALVEDLALEAPTLWTELSALITSIAHGEGGTAKVATVASNLANLGQTVSGIAQGVSGVKPAA